MATTEVVVKGAVTADGQLILDEPPDVPPGRVEVTVRVVPDDAPKEHPMFETLRRIHAELDARGVQGPQWEGDRCRRARHARRVGRATGGP